jgi:two-component sensor histidine kinase
MAMRRRGAQALQYMPITDSPVRPEQEIPASSPHNTVNAAIVLIVVLFGLFVVILGYSTMRARDNAEARAHDRAAAASQVVAINTKWIVELAWQALRRVDEALGPVIASGTGSTVRDMREATTNLPGTVKIYVVDANGRTLFSTDPEVESIDITDRSYFSALAQGALWHTSELMVSRLNGQQIFAFSRRLERNGRFAGAAIVSFDVTLFEEVWRSLALDDRSTVSIIRSDGRLVARYPLAAGPLDLSNYVLFTDYLKKSDEGTYFAVSPADGVERYVGYRRIPGTDLIALASVSSAGAFAIFRQHTILTMLLALPAAIGLAIASIWIVRLLQRDAGRQEELARTLELNRLLFRDTHHRVKNNLQSVQSLVRMQNIPAEAKLDLQRRIAAMTAVHEHMYRLDQYVEVSAAELVPAIVQPLIQSFDSAVKVDFALDDVQVDRDHATALALLVNEVVTNALKYAYAAGEAGTLSIALEERPGGRAQLTIRDGGKGFDPDTATEGMGSRLIRGMMMQLDGDYSYTNEAGAVFTADIAIRAGAEPLGTQVADAEPPVATAAE